jgi:subfamily B ATP-binding cassette protein HlyB/CyaB
MSSDRSDPCVSLEAMLWALAALSHRHQAPFDPRAMAAELAPMPRTFRSFLHAADQLGFRTTERKVTAAEFAGLDLPCVVAVADDSDREARRSAGIDGPAQEQPDGTAWHVIAVVSARRGAKLLVRAPEDASPNEVDPDHLLARCQGRVTLVERPVRDQHAGAGKSQPDPVFGLRWVARETFRHSDVWRDVLIASAAIQLVALLVPLLTQVVIDKVIVHQTTSTLLVVAAALAMVMVFTALTTWIRQYLVLHAGNRIDAVLGGAVFDHLMRLPPRYFEHRPTGTLVARMQGIETIREFLAGAGITLILDVPFLLLFLAIMFHYSVTLSLVVLGIIAGIVLLSVVVTPVLRGRVDRQFLAGARNQAFLTEFVAAIETVKSQQMEPQLRARFRQLLADYLEASMRTRSLASTFNVLAGALEQAMTVVVLCLGAWLVMNDGSLTVGMLVAFQMFAARVSGPMLRIAGLWQEFQRVEIAARRLGDILGARPEPYSLEPFRLSAARGRLRLRGLGFQYVDGGPFLFRGLDLALEPGTCVALMGPSGSGKSTIARLLQGFYLPTEGQILLDDVDTRNMAANELRGHLGVVPQETRLFSGTLFENLALSVPQASLADVEEACRLADLHPVITRMPHGYQTRIGEQGSGLSGGQKQRLAVARALLRRPRFLVFDEATSSLDAESAAAIAATINRLRGHVSILFIAHQLPPGLVVDRTLSLAPAADTEGRGDHGPRA